MKKYKKEWEIFISDMRFYIVILLVFVICAVSSLYLLQEELLKNAHLNGNALANSYCTEEERRATGYESIVKVQAARLELLLNSGGEARVEEWLNQFSDDLRVIVGDGVLDIYAVVNGKFVTLSNWEEADSYDYGSTDWYNEALNADGKVIYTDVYSDVVHHRGVITIAAKSGSGSNVVAFDIFPENFRVEDNSVELPKDGSYFLCDREGNILYAPSFSNANDEEKQQYIYGIMEKIRNGELESADSHVYDFDGRKRGVYYSVASNGWYSIVTVPFDTILHNLRLLTIGFGLVFLVFLLFTGIVGVRNYKLNRRMERTNKTVRVLGNSYYAIYQVNIKDGTYEMIKGSEYMRRNISVRGEYGEFLKVASGIIEEEACKEFMSSFSLENICKLVENRVHDFGGDFLRRFGDEYRWVNIRIVYDEMIDQRDVVLCFREVEEEKQAQFQNMRLLQNALDKAQKNEESREQFFSSMSHDMRTPLNAIVGLSELAAVSVNDAEKTKDYINKINLSSRQMLTLINDILELSRLKQGKIDLNKETFDLKNTINECVDIFRPQAAREEKEINLFFNVRNTKVMGDPLRITQIMNNILSNAVKFTGKGGRIDINVRQVDFQKYAKYQFVISDNGRGMSEEYLKKLFEPYEREIRFDTGSVSGTGLGMPIVKSIVSQMDGQIAVESVLGEGSTFTVTLPLEISDNDRYMNETEEQNIGEDFSALKGRHILLAEDNAVNMEIATELFDMQGVKVTQAWNGLEAVEKFTESELWYYDAVLMDMQMPEMNGCDAARAIRSLSREDASLIPIVAVTANAFAEDISATTEAGMNAHVSKPIDFPALYKVLIELMKKKQ